LRQPCHSEMKDMEVIEYYLETQDPMCFSLLYGRYAGKIYSKCISLLKEESLAQDATQEIFMKVFTNLSRFAERSKFSTWVYSITYNYCIDFLRRRKKQQDVFSDEMEKAADVADDDVSDEVLLAMEVRQLKAVLEQIPVDDKAILLMKYQDELSIKEIADMLDKSESAVKMRLKRAKEKAQSLREELFPVE